MTRRQFFAALGFSCAGLALMNTLPAEARNGDGTGPDGKGPRNGRECDGSGPRRPPRDGRGRGQGGGNFRPRNDGARGYGPRDGSGPGNGPRDGGGPRQNAPRE